MLIQAGTEFLGSARIPEAQLTGPGCQFVEAGRRQFDEEGIAKEIRRKVGGDRRWWGDAGRWGCTCRAFGVAAQGAKREGEHASGDYPEARHLHGYYPGRLA